jgi:hypothetical protein
MKQLPGSFTHKHKATSVRLRKRLLRARVKGSLPIRFSNEALTAHAGLAVVGDFLQSAGWVEQIRKIFAEREFDTDYGSFRMTLAVIGMLVIGGTRLAHLRELAIDPVFLRFARFDRLPTERTLSRWLKDISEGYRDRLRELLRDVAFSTWAHGQLRRVTIDLDGTVVRTGTSVDGAERGYNPHHPKDPSYFPLTAHLAQTGQILDVVNRPGRVNDAEGAVDRLRLLIDEVRSRLGNVPIEVRLDGAFCHAPVLELLTATGVEFAMKMPMWKWLDVRDRISERKRWAKVHASVDGFSLSLRLKPWKRTERVVVFRKRISGKPAKDFQLELFQPDDGYYEYSMVVTNKMESEATIWHFMAGRGAHEKTLGELKQNFAFGSVVTNDWDANSTWQLLSALTHNLVRDFQLQTGLAAARRNSRKRTYRYSFRSMRTLRFLLIHLPGRIVRPQGRSELRIAAATSTRERIESVLDAIAA